MSAPEPAGVPATRSGGRLVRTGVALVVGVGILVATRAMGTAPPDERAHRAGHLPSPPSVEPEALVDESLDALLPEDGTPASDTAQRIVAECLRSLAARRGVAANAAERVRIESAEIRLLATISSLRIDALPDAADLATAAWDRAIADEPDDAALDSMLWLVTGMLRAKRGISAERAWLDRVERSAGPGAARYASYYTARSIVEYGGDLADAGERLRRLASGPPLRAADVAGWSYEIEHLTAGRALPRTAVDLLGGNGIELAAPFRRPTVLAFVAVGCGACGDHRQAVGDWEARARAGGFDVVLTFVGTDGIDVTRAAVGSADIPESPLVRVGVARRDPVRPASESDIVRDLRVVQFPKAIAVDRDGRVLANSVRSTPVEVADAAARAACGAGDRVGLRVSVGAGD